MSNQLNRVIPAYLASEDFKVVLNCKTRYLAPDQY
jgi:hypothetical protein